MEVIDGRKKIKFLLPLKYMGFSQLFGCLSRNEIQKNPQAFRLSGFFIAHRSAIRYSDMMPSSLTAYRI